MNRLEEIKERIQRGQELYPDDPKVLLERIEHLERENERLKVVLKGEREGMPALIERIEHLERENERLDAEAESYANQVGLLEQENKRLREIADAAHAIHVAGMPGAPEVDKYRLLDAFRAANYPTVYADSNES